MIGKKKCCCGTIICVTVCGNIPVVGATINVYTTGGGTLLASCVTGTNGCCSIALTGTYLVQVVVGGTVVNSANRTLSGTGINIPLGGGANVVCCGGYAIPQVLTLTDALGALSFVYYPNSFNPTWYSGRVVQRLSCSVTTPNNICVAALPSQGPVRVCYQMYCDPSTQPVFKFQRSWSWVYQPGTLDPIWYQDPSGIIAGQPCGTGPPAMCGAPHVDASLDSQNPTTTSPFLITFNPVEEPGNFTPDPVGGSVVASA